MPQYAESDIDLAIRLAAEGSAVALKQFRNPGLETCTKSDLSPVSLADHKTEQAMIALLERERPDDALLTEESGAFGKGDREWIIDPIDGTRQYLLGLPYWATLVALRENDEIVVAAIDAPALGRRWSAAKGSGAWVDGTERIEVSNVSALEGATLQHSDLGAWEKAGGSEPLVALSRRCMQTMGVGVFWMHCLVAEGRSEIALQPGVKTWDMAAPSLVVEEAGGRFSSLHGLPGPEHGTGLSTNGLLHGSVLDILSGFDIAQKPAAEF